MRKIIKISISLILVGLLAACNPTEQKNTIVMGFTPGNYSLQFEKGIQPYLEQKGYKIVVKNFTQSKQVPQIIKDNDIDASVNMSTAAMMETNRRINSDMIAWADTASAPQSLRSIKHTALSDVRDGMTIGLPNDPVNLERAVHILEELGWVTVDPEVETIVFSTQAVSPNQYDLNLVPMDAAQLPRALEDLDFAVINGNYVVSQGERISDGLAVEVSPPQHLVKVVIREANKNEQWAKDLKEAYESKEFEAYIKSERLFDGFIYPVHWNNGTN